MLTDIAGAAVDAGFRALAISSGFPAASIVTPFAKGLWGQKGRQWILSMCNELIDSTSFDICLVADNRLIYFGLLCVPLVGFHRGNIG